MQPRIFHGSLTPETLGAQLVAEFDRGGYRAQKFGDSRQVVVQIATRDHPVSGGDTALTITLLKVEDGISIQLGQQSWFGIAASLGKTAFSAWRNPWTLLDRLDDLAQDIEHLRLTEQVWGVIDRAARAQGASFELSERLRRVVCPYCSTANLVGEPSCMACGAPLGTVQPDTCANCGYVVRASDRVCPNCTAKL
jgi:RNA polymerase subunit RPABC4/transcription elongation factor Spt4